jgi:hypothetical protein
MSKKFSGLIGSLLHSRKWSVMPLFAFALCVLVSGFFIANNSFAEEIVVSEDPIVVEVPAETPADVPAEVPDEEQDEAPAEEQSEAPTEDPVGDLEVLPPGEEEVAPEEEAPLMAAALPDPIWNISDDGKTAVTFSSLVAEETYIAPMNASVTARFTRLPENSGKLTIKEVLLSEEEAASLGSVSRTVYDISSDMENGTFEYVLTLPVPSDKKVSVKAADSVAEAESAETVAEDKQSSGGVVTIEGLDHFTVFIIVDDGDAKYSDTVPAATPYNWSTHGTGYSGDHRWIQPTKQGATAAWEFSGSAGKYAILISWTVWNDHATNAKYYSDNIEGFEAVIDQKKMADGSSAANGTWSGWYAVPGEFDLRNKDSVKLSVVSDTNGNLSADAVAFVSLSAAKFIGSPRFVKADDAGQLVAVFKAPDIAEEGRFTVDGTEQLPATSSKAGPGADFTSFELVKALPAGSHSINGEYRIAGNWYPVQGSSDAFAITDPTGSFVIPNASSMYFRPGDNPLRIKASDILNSLKKVVFKLQVWDETKNGGKGKFVSAGTFNVLRSVCDIRYAGNYLLCDINDAANWASLAEGRYKALADIRTEADDAKLLNIGSEEFFVDGTAPVIEDFIIDGPKTIETKSIILSLSASDASGIKDARFYITSPRASDGKCDGNGTNIMSVTVTAPEADGRYRTTFDTTSLTGTYCLNAVVGDLAAGHSAISKIQAVFDNTGPAAPTITTPANGQYFTKAPIRNEWSAVTDPSGIKNYRIEYVYDDGHTFADAPYRTLTGTWRNHSPNKNEQGGVTIRVQAIDNADNEGAWSSAVHYFYDETAPAVPSLIAPLDNSFVSGGLLVNSWSASSADTVRYVYESYHDSEGVSLRWTQTVNAPSTSKSASNVADSVFWWRVKAIDAAGNESAWSPLWKVTVDNTAPVISLLGEATMNIPAGSVWTEPGATASDVAEGDISSRIVSTGSVNTLIPGTYELFYDVADSAGNAAAQVKRTVIVTDSTAPVITLIGDATVNITVGAEWRDPGATATDDLDGDISENIVYSGIVDTLKVRTYELFYDVSDAAGNRAEQVKRTVNVMLAQSFSGVIPWLNHSPFIPQQTPPPTQGSGDNGGSSGSGGEVAGAETFYFANDLRFGMSGNDVSELQKRFTAEGLFDDEATGYFGMLTLKAAKAYQKKYGLPETGFVGPMTRAILNGESETVESLQARIDALKAQLALLLAKLGR